MQYLIPSILFLISIGVFFSFIDPLYSDVQAVKAESVQLAGVLKSTQKIQNIRDSLLEKFNTIATVDKEKLNKILPDNVDNVRLILEIDKVAFRHGMLIKNIGISGEGEEEGISLGPRDTPYGSIDLDITVTGSYDSFRDFIVDVEKSLRIVDIVGLSSVVKRDDLSEYTIGLRTYWLR